MKISKICVTKDWMPKHSQKYWIVFTEVCLCTLQLIQMYYFYQSLINVRCDCFTINV